MTYHTRSYIWAERLINNRLTTQHLSILLQVLFAQGAAHADDCGVMLFDPCFPGRDPLLHLLVAHLLGKGVPCRHARASFAAEKDREECIIRAHGYSFTVG